VILAQPEVERRLKRLSQMRNFFVTMRRECQSAHSRGEWLYDPPYDIRSDVEYWKKLASQNEAVGRPYCTPESE